MRVMLIGTVLGLLAGCAEKKRAAVEPVTESVATTVVADENVVRVGGDMEAQATFVDGMWRYDRMLIDTPLPEGYPGPTPPGAIEIKQYPAARRAQVSRTGLPDVGMNLAFWPLFQHIKRRDIAMTSPVEMEYAGVAPRSDEAPERDYGSTSGSWTMAFLYRTPDLGPIGEDRGGVEVVDVEPMRVLAIGFRGAYGVQRVEEGLFTLEEWLQQQQEWERAGEPRAMYYNGPERRGGLKWGEVQVPVRRKSGV